MEESFNNKERRVYPRYFIDLTLEYRDKDDSSLRGGIVVNASEGGFLIESTRDIPIGTELDVTVLFSKGFELADFKAVTKIVRKEPYWQEDWKGYEYGLEFTQILDDDRRKLNLLISCRYNLEEIHTIHEVYAGRETEF